MKVGWNELLISGQLDVYSRLLDLLDPHLEEAIDYWQQDVERQAQLIDDEDTRREFLEFHSDEYHEQMEFRVILMNSFFVASFASFENQLMRICMHAKRNSGSPFSVTDLRSSSPTENAKKYLKKLGIEFPADSEEWQKITKYRQIRNKIMHEGARLRANIDENNLIKFAKGNQIHSGGSLELTRVFCDEALVTMKQFLLDVRVDYNRWLKTDVGLLD